MVRVLVGNRRIEIEEFIGVCFSLDEVHLDDASLRRLEAATKPSPKHKTKPSPPRSHTDLTVTAEDALDSVQARALVFSQLIRAMAGRSSVGPNIIEFLAEILNRDINLMLARGSRAIESLCNAIGGLGSVRDDDVIAPLQDVLGKCGLEAPGLSEVEAKSLGR